MINRREPPCNWMRGLLTTKAYFACNRIGRIVRIQLWFTNKLSLCSVKVYGGKFILSFLVQNYLQITLFCGHV